MRTFQILGTLCGFLALPILNGQAAAIDASVHIPANYTTMQPPASQASYKDSTYGTSILRVSNALATPDVSAGGMLQWVETEYSTANPFSSDNAHMILQQDSYYGLYTGAGAFVANLPLEIDSASEPRWSRVDNNTLYYHIDGGNQLKTYNVATGVASLIQTFSKYTSITGKGKTDISYDGDHFIFIGCTSQASPCPGANQQLFIYQISTGAQFPIITNTPDGVSVWNNVFISPNNEAVVSWLTPGTARYQGVEVYDQQGNFLRQIAHADGHSKMSRDINGDEVFVWTNSADPQPLCGQNAIVKVHMADGVQTCLLSLDWSLGVHITAADSTWVYVETYTDQGNDVIPPTGWTAYMDEIIQIKMDGSQINRLVQHRSRPLNDYNYMPKLSASRDGSRFAYGSDFGLQLLNGAPQQYMDAYLIMVPQTVTLANGLGQTASSSSTGTSTNSGATGSSASSTSSSSSSTSAPASSASSTSPTTSGVTAVVNGASFQSALAPGSIVSIFGNALSSTTLTASGNALPDSLGIVNVYFNGIPAPLYYAGPGQVNAQIPYEVAPGAVNMEVDGTTVSRQTINVAATAPGIFTTNGSGTGAGVILRAQDYQVIAASTPTTAGAYILIYCTGLGATATPVTDGAPAPAGGNATVATPQVTIGSSPAQVTYSGLAPGFVGLYQVNAQVPASAPKGNAVPVVLSVNGVNSNTATIVIQ
jgi:uncharacterized protein (TIGR03437 family)